MRAAKLFFGAVITVVAVVGSPYLFQWLGWVGPLQRNAWLVLLVAGAGLLIKLYVADRAADGEFLFHKFGYDNCMITFGAVLTALAIQLQSGADLFPGLSSVAPLAALSPRRDLQVFILLLAALVASLATAHISGEIKRGKHPDKGFWPLLNSIIGCAMLATYVLVLITKG